MEGNQMPEPCGEGLYAYHTFRYGGAQFVQFHTRADFFPGIDRESPFKYDPRIPLEIMKFPLDMLSRARIFVAYMNQFFLVRATPHCKNTLMVKDVRAGHDGELKVFVESMAMETQKRIHCNMIFAHAHRSDSMETINSVATNQTRFWNGKTECRKRLLKYFEGHPDERDRFLDDYPILKFEPLDFWYCCYDKIRITEITFNPLNELGQVDGVYNMWTGWKRNHGECEQSWADKYPLDDETRAALKDIRQFLLESKPETLTAARYLELLGLDTDDLQCWFGEFSLSGESFEVARVYSMFISHHFLFKIFNGWIAGYRAFLDQVAFKIQKPACKLDYHTIAVGPVGIGKTSPFKAIGEAMGYSTYVNTTSALTARFNESLIGSMFVVADEFNSRKGVDTDVLKTLLSESELVVERKFGDRFSCPWHATFFISANKLQFNYDPRRWLVADCSKEEVPVLYKRLLARSLGLDREYWHGPEQYELIGTCAWLYKCCWARDISGLNRSRRPPSSHVAKDLQLQQGDNVLYQLTNWVLRGYHLNTRPRHMAAQTLIDEEREVNGSHAVPIGSARRRDSEWLRFVDAEELYGLFKQEVGQNSWRSRHMQGPEEFITSLCSIFQVQRRSEVQHVPVPPRQHVVSRAPGFAVGQSNAEQVVYLRQCIDRCQEMIDRLMGGTLDSAVTETVQEVKSYLVLPDLDTCERQLCNHLCWTRDDLEEMKSN